MGIRKIKQITLCIRDKDTYKVGGSYYPDSPDSPVVVTSITRESDGGCWVYNNQGGKTFFAGHYVDQESIVKGW